MIVKNFSHRMEENKLPSNLGKCKSSWSNLMIHFYIPNYTILLYTTVTSECTTLCSFLVRRWSRNLRIDLNGGESNLLLLRSWWNFKWCFHSTYKFPNHGFNGGKPLPLKGFCSGGISLCCFLCFKAVSALSLIF